MGRFRRRPPRSYPAPTQLARRLRTRALLPGSYASRAQVITRPLLIASLSAVPLKHASPLVIDIVFTESHYTAMRHSTTWSSAARHVVVAGAILTRAHCCSRRGDASGDAAHTRRAPGPHASIPCEVAGSRCCRMEPRAARLARNRSGDRFPISVTSWNSAVRGASGWSGSPAKVHTERGSCFKVTRRGTFWTGARRTWRRTAHALLEDAWCSTMPGPDYAGARIFRRYRMSANRFTLRSKRPGRRNTSAVRGMCAPAPTARAFVEGFRKCPCRHLRLPSLRRPTK